MKHFIITKAAGLNILWLWDSKSENFQKLDEGIFIVDNLSMTEAKVGDSEKIFRFFWIEDDKLHQTPQYCSDIKKYDKCLIYQKDGLWYLRRKNVSGKDECLGKAENYGSFKTKQCFYLKSYPEENYTMSFLTADPFKLIQKQYSKPFFICDETIVVERNDGYFDIYCDGTLSKAKLLVVEDYSKEKLYEYIPEAGAHKFLAEEEMITVFDNAYLIRDKDDNTKLYAVSDEGQTNLVDEGKYKQHNNDNIIQINDKLYPVRSSIVQLEKARLTLKGKLKILLRKLS